MLCNGRSRLPTAAEETALGLRAQAGDLNARDDLAMASFGLVASIVDSYHQRPDEELDQAGMLGLIEAADRFDPAAYPGLRFSTIATYWIRLRVRYALKARRIVRVPNYLECRDGRGRKGEKTLENHRRNRELAAAARRGHRYFAGWGEADAPDRVPEPADPATLGRGRPGPIDDAAGNLMAVLSTLPAMQGLVIRRHYGLCGEESRSLARIGEECRLSTGHVRKIRRAALAAMRGALCALEENPSCVA